MDKKKHETKKKNTFDVETSIIAAVNVMFTQMQATWGFNLFGELSVAAMIKERRPYARKNKLVTAINPESLSAEDKAKSLNAVNLMKQKRGVIINTP